ncbi:membrane protein insertion efficiency factor YidD [Massilia forsythiae]|uniref:membrane protein insertion efficiency factor YidD n=1 Tax=Massilia forsythiae TaxID=2728020 RepID=UPI001B7D0969|nr:membrane protein insertion efficiency factor YidD [Massilia forsythiae]
MSGAWATRCALAAIRAYQRWLSPHKGFCCALRAATGADSCSAYGYRVIERFGLRRGLGLLDRRLALCGQVHRRAPPAPLALSGTPGAAAPPGRRAQVRPPLPGRQGGFCDVPSCDCDLPGCDAHARSGAGKVCDALDCASDAADCLPERWRRRPQEGSRQRIAALADRIRRNRARRRMNGRAADDRDD